MCCNEGCKRRTHQQRKQHEWHFHVRCVASRSLVCSFTLIEQRCASVTIETGLISPNVIRSYSEWLMAVVGGGGGVPSSSSSHSLKHLMLINFVANNLCNIFSAGVVLKTLERARERERHVLF